MTDPGWDAIAESGRDAVLTEPRTITLQARIVGLVIVGWLTLGLNAVGITGLVAAWQHGWLVALAAGFFVVPLTLLLPWLGFWVAWSGTRAAREG